MVETEAISQGDFCRPRSTEQAHVPLAPTTFRWWPCWGMFFFPIKGALQMWFGWSLHLGQGGDPEKSVFFVGFHGSNPDSCYGVPATFEAQINSLLPPNLNSSCFWKWTQRCCESLHCPCSWLWLPLRHPIIYIYIYLKIHIITYYEVVTQFAWYGYSTKSKLHELHSPEPLQRRPFTLQLYCLYQLFFERNKPICEATWYSIAGGLWQNVGPSPP